MIERIRGAYVVLSEKTARSFGSYKTLAEAKRRLRQVEFFKAMAKHPGSKRKPRKNSNNAGVA